MTNPTTAYIGTLKPSGQRGMLHALNIVAAEVSGGMFDAQTMPWRTVTSWQAAQVANKLAVKHSSAYVQKILSAFRGVVKHAHPLGDTNPVCREVCKAATVKRQPAPKAGRVLSVTEAGLMLAHLDATDSRVAVRDAAMLEYILNTGTRRTALVALPHDAEVPETPRMNAWKRQRGNEPGPLFCKISDPTKPLTDQVVRLVVRNAAQKAGIGNVTAEDLRRTSKARSRNK